jgi:Tol biopolymer transport system component
VVALLTVMATALALVGVESANATRSRALAGPGPRTVKISKDPDPTSGGFSIQPALSRNGRLVAFESSVRLLPGDTNNLEDVYFRDRAAGVTTLVSATSSRTPGIGSQRPAITPDGRFIAYDSDADNLVPGDTNGNGDVFIKDLSTGTTRRVSVADGGGDPNASASQPAISADGRFVAFVSGATNLVPDDTNGRGDDVFVRDLSAGTTERVSVSSAGVQGNISAVEESVAISGTAASWRSHPVQTTWSATTPTE